MKYCFYVYFKVWICNIYFILETAMGVEIDAQTKTPRFAEDMER